MRNGSQTGLNIAPTGRFLAIPGYTDTGKPVFWRGQNRDQPDQNDRDTYGITLTQSFSTSLGDWVAITNYREYDHDLYSDDDGVEFVWLQTHRKIDHKQFSQELRTTIDINEDTQILVGGYYFTQKYFLDQQGKLDGFLPGLGQPQTQDQKTDSYSLFSQLYYDLNDQWRLQAGLRYTHEKKKATSTTANTINLSGQATFDDPIIPGTFIESSGDKSWDEFGYKAGVDYQANDDMMFYGYYARGFKSGGFTGRIVVAEDIGPYDPEYVDTFELGMKSDFLDNRVRANVAAFYNKYKDMQIVQNITYPSGANSATILNAAEAETWGGELDLTAAVTDNLTLNATLAYLHAEFQKFNTPGGQNLEGNKLQDSPKWSSSESITYFVPLSSGQLEFFAQHNYTDEKFSYFDNLPLTKIGSYSLFNAHITYSAADDRWSVGLYGRNLGDKKYFTQKLDFGVFALAGVGAPREYGVDFKFNW
jgi:iron complex outermembrane receptor protein